MIVAVKFFFIPCLLLILTACERAPTTTPQHEPPPVILPESVRQITPAEATQLIASTPDLVLIDARRVWEIQEQGRLPKSQNIDWLSGEDYVVKEVTKLDKTKPYLVFCAIGARSKLVLEKMVPLGFERLFWLKGGLNAWIADGRAVEK